MTHAATRAEIDAARGYESLLVPALFGEWAPRTADAARIERGDRVLDVACGTGVLAREAHARVGSEGSVVGLDPGAGMLAIARQLAPAVDWRRGAAESLPFGDGTFDVALCQFGLMFFADRTRALREMLRVLTPAGRLAVAVFDELPANPAYAAEVSLLEREAGRAAADALRAPFALGDRESLAALLSESGAGSVSVRTQRGTARFPSVRVMVEADLRGWLPVMGVTLAEDRIERILGEAEEVLRDHVDPAGRVSFETSAHIVTARRSEE